jgi:hypothetical protein
VKYALRPIDVGDDALTDWDKATTRLEDFQAPEPYAPFGDVHLSWRPEGLYLAGIASNYVDLELLHYKDKFPLAETFQLHLLIEDDKHKIHHYAIHLIPKQSRQFTSDWDKRVEIEPEIYRYSGGRPVERLPAGDHVQRLIKPLPHIAIESFFPAEWFGREKFEGGQKFRLNVLVVNFYREWTMSLSGRPSLQHAADPSAWRAVALEDPPGLTASRKIHRAPKLGCPGLQTAEKRVDWANDSES